jgi:hypothetical protein
VIDIAGVRLAGGDPGWIRTSDLQLRRLLLYPLSYGVDEAGCIVVAVIWQSVPRGKRGQPAAFVARLAFQTGIRHRRGCEPQNDEARRLATYCIRHDAFRGAFTAVRNGGAEAILAK